MKFGMCLAHYFYRFQVRQDDESSSLSLSAIARTTCHPHKSHVLVGGLGGFGLELAQWLVERGARYLVLTSPVGVCSGYQDRRIRQWRQAGITVTVSTGVQQHFCNYKLKLKQ